MGVTFKTNKLKVGLADKTKASKKHFEFQTGMAAKAATAPASLLADMVLEKRLLADLKNLPRRVRKSEKDQVERVAESVRAYRQSAPLIISQAGEIVHGHVVAQALRMLGETEAWCAVVDHLDAHQQELLHLALNRIGECGDWDIEALGSLVIDLGSLDFDLTATGFTLPEIDILTAPTVAAAGENQEEEPEPPSDPVSQAGDVWLLGDHRVACADATHPESYAAALAGRSAALVFTDCPWNILIEGFVSGLGKVKHKNFKMGAGEMTAEQFIEFCNTFHKLASDHLADGSIFFSCIDWRSVDIIMAAGKQAGLRHINTVVWNKGSGGMGSPYRSAHEFVVVFAKGEKIATNNIELGKHGRDRTNVWSYPGANRRGSSAAKALAHHPTPKPVEMVEDAIKDVTRLGDLVLDPFLGSGTTLLAAERCGRVAAAIELDPGYVDVAVARWEEMTGKHAILEATGLSFLEVKAERAEGELKAA